MENSGNPMKTKLAKELYPEVVNVQVTSSRVKTKHLVQVLEEFKCNRDWVFEEGSYVN